jgi:AraC-like DNA-binding protein
MATATLQRRLGAEGTSFQRVKDQSRREAAECLLRDDTLTVSEIAARLGFSDASSFVRAFRKWTGRTPAQCR